MRQIFPTPLDDLDDDALFAAYAHPEERLWVRANMVSSLDGAASLEGRSGGLSSPADKRVFRVLRALADVVLVGASTVRAEGYAAVLPKETAPERRAAAGQPPTAAIAVVTRSLDLDLGSRLFSGPRRSLVVTCAAAGEERLAAAAEVADVVVAGDDGVDLRRAVDALAERGLRRVLCEGGPGVLAQAVAAGVVDELCLTLSPQLAAGSASRILAGPALDPAVRFRLASVLQEQDELLLRYSCS
nr:pyrimidine reductase family protein [Motilibacter rhizosphaerae]